MEKQLNANEIQYVEAFTNAFAKGLFNQGIVKGVKPEDLHKYFMNPDDNQGVLTDIINYYYMANAEIRQLLEMVEALPSLNYKINVFEQPNDNDKNMTMLKRHLHTINHKALTRDLIKQNASSGNVVGLWLGKGKKFHPFIFSDLNHVKLVRDYYGQLRVGIDFSWLDGMSEAELKLFFEQFDGIISIKDYNAYLKDSNLRYHLVPFERSIVLRTGTTNRNQINGSNWINPVMFDILHKKKLKDVEQTIANKIINAVAVLTMGQTSKQGEKGRDYDDIPPKLVRDIHQNVKSALSNSAKEGISLVTIPNFSKIEFADIKSDGLDGDKFSQSDSDIRAGLGVSGVMMNGEGSTVASAKLNLEIFYKRLGVMLEDIESEVYNKLFNLLLPKTQKDNYYMEYQKEMPLSYKEKVDYIAKLNDKGWSSRHYIEAIGLDYEAVLEQTVYENDVLKLNTELLIPPKTSHTSSGSDDENGRPEVDDVENENTERSKEVDGNNNR